ncbi:MAG: NAD(P)(+) transhydrogenase (Re/Si-specific) subunit beta [Bacteroidetes bacterium]|nr:NAD(P)(+) transhydrogenase (Re/Si-specific) subunit beta [Bacteroidota bacterium]
MLTQIVNLGYLAGVILFIIGLRQLSSPKTARQGNLWAAAGMGIAILVTLILPLEKGDNNYILILVALAIGSVIGLLASKRIAMTDMPQLVSIFNGLGGACAVAISVVELVGHQEMINSAGIESIGLGTHLTALLAMFVGGIAFTGSLIAWGKLDGKIDDRKVRIPQSTIVNLIILAVIVGGMTFKMISPAGETAMMVAWGVLVLSLIYGITFVIPIGGADMPVVISLLNAFTGVAAALAGLVYDNQVMLVGGILVGSSGTILTVLMCQAMNRSLINVIIGGFGSTGTARAQDGDQVAKEITLNDMAILLAYSQNVMIVPGYGMAVAQAQKVCYEIDKLLESNGVNVTYAIHPVAGRMPGHMNVLLAEADVPYTKLLDLEDANNKLNDTDVVIVVGANDVVNPAALDDPGSPIYGMPILEILRAKTTIVLKRSMSPGYAGIQNPLFFHEKNRMLFGDAKSSLENLAAEIKSIL